MRILHININDIKGGAARSAYRLHTGMRESGVDSNMLVQNKASNDRYIQRPRSNIAKALLKISGYLDALPLKFYAGRNIKTWSTQWLPNNIAQEIIHFKPDIVHLHWIGGGFIPITAFLQLRCPIVWTLHDMWAFTGGCHYDEACGRYGTACGKCPQLNSKNKNDLSHFIWKNKKNSWKDIKITVVTPSNWLAKCAKTSSLFKDHYIKVIPYGLDLKVFTPMSKISAKRSLGLAGDKKLILFGAQFIDDARKGFEYLRQSLVSLAEQGLKDGIEVGIFGKLQNKNFPDLGLRVHNFEAITSDAKLDLLYSAADVFVCPSVQDNFPNTVMEALACGTPCVAFDIGGISDLIEHEVNGYLAKPFKIEDLAQGIMWILDDKNGYDKLALQARLKAEQKFSSALQVQSYIELYKKMLEATN